MEAFAIASFRSRQQVMQFQNILRRQGIKSSVISTPREVAVGCGLSLRFDISDAKAVVELAKKTRPDTLVGFYTLERNGVKWIAKPMPTQF